MSQEIEIEVKTLITEEAYNALLHSFSLTADKAVVQHNHYFETPSFFLKASHAGLRIREREGTFTLTLKQPHTVGVLETHQTLSTAEAKEALKTGLLPKGEVLSALLELHVPTTELQHLGTLTTSRIELDYERGTLCLDKSSYFDVVDYEIEFEGQSSEHANMTLTHLLNEFGLNKKPTQNKVRRFFNRRAKAL